MVSATDASMRAARIGTAAAALALACGAAGPASGGDAVAAVAQPRVAQPDASRRHDLLRLLHRDCGACHGMRLTGGLGPPLTPDALRGKPEDALIATILDGRPGTAMPPWRPFLSGAEAAWIAERLLAGEERAR